MPGNYCAVVACPNSRRRTRDDPARQHIVYHRFPADPARNELWARFARRASDWSPVNCSICSAHFTQDDYQRDLKAELLNLPPKKALKKTAVPSVRSWGEDSLGDSKTETDVEQEASLQATERRRFVNEILEAATAGTAAAAARVNVRPAAERLPGPVPLPALKRQSHPAVTPQQAEGVKRAIAAAPKHGRFWLDVKRELSTNRAIPSAFNFVCVEEEAFDYGTASTESGACRRVDSV